MKPKLIMTAILVVSATALAVTATMFEIGMSQQKAYADEPQGTTGPLCPSGYHWNNDLHTCVAD
jgi:hypothetical protein